DKSKLVLMCEGKAKPMMPPAKAKFHPSKEEVALLRAWVAAGAKDDAADGKVGLPAIKAKNGLLPPGTALAYDEKCLRFARNERLTYVFFNDTPPTVRESSRDGKITALAERRTKAEATTFVAAFSSTGKKATVFAEQGIPATGECPAHTDAI